MPAFRLIDAKLPDFGTPSIVGGCAVMGGLTAAALTGSAVADPIDEISRGLRHIE